MGPRLVRPSMHQCATCYPVCLWIHKGKCDQYLGICLGVDWTASRNDRRMHCPQYRRWDGSSSDLAYQRWISTRSTPQYASGDLSMPRACCSALCFVIFCEVTAHERITLASPTKRLRFMQSLLDQAGEVEVSEKSEESKYLRYIVNARQGRAVISQSLDI
jgi:hypothetical protein